MRLPHIAEHEEMNMHDVIHVSDNVRRDLMKTQIEPLYRSIVERTIRSKFFWRRTGVILEAASKILIVVAGVISFSTSYFEDERDILSFASGSVSCVSLGCIQCSSFAYKAHKEQARELNVILRKLKIDTVPVLHKTETPPTRAVRKHHDEIHF